MKKLIYIIVLIVIINNIFLINKNSALKKEISAINKNSNNQEYEIKKNYIDYLHKISESIYLKNIQNINISSNHLEIKFKLNSSKEMKFIVDDIEKCFERPAIKTNIYNDEYIIIEFGE